MFASVLDPSIAIRLAVIVMLAMTSSGLHATEPSAVVGAWNISIDSPNALQSIDLDLGQEETGWKATLQSAAGKVVTRRVSLKDDMLVVTYGDQPFNVRVELTIADETMQGQVITGEGDTLLRQTITAQRAQGTGANPAQEQIAESKEMVEDARPYLGVWEITLAPLKAESGQSFPMGMLVTESGGKLVVGHSGFGMRGPPRTVEWVHCSRDGLRWPLDGGVFGPLVVEVVSEDGKVKVNVRGAGQGAFLSGTAIRKPNASDVGLNREQLVQEPRTEFVGGIDGKARVVATDRDQLIIQQGPLVSRIVKEDPFFCLFEWFRLPELARLVSVESGVACCVTGVTLENWDVRDSKAPVILGSCELPGNAPELVNRSGDRVFAANWNGQADSQQIHVIDVSEPSRPKLLMSQNTPKGLSNYDMSVSDSIIYLANADGLRMMDVSKPDAIVNRGRFKGRGRWVRGVDVVGPHAYIATSMHGDASWLQIIDVADPSAPVQRSIYQSTGGAQDVAVSEGLAVLADRAAGVIVLDVSDPSNVRRVGYFRTKGRANQVTIFGELAFVVVDSDRGVRTLQVIRYRN